VGAADGGRLQSRVLSFPYKHKMRWLNLLTQTPALAEIFLEGHNPYAHQKLDAADVDGLRQALQSNEVLQAYAIGRIVGAGRGVWAVTDQAVLLREDGQQGVTRIALNQVKTAQAVRGRFGHVLRLHTSGGAHSLFGVARELAAGFHQSLASLEVASQFDDAQAHSRHWRDDAPEGWLQDCLSDARQRLAHA
jgi:hypothetical protein